MTGGAGDQARSAQGAASSNHRGVPGYADLDGMVGSGLFPQLVGSRSIADTPDGKVTHEQCCTCKLHIPRIERTFTHDEMRALNGGHPVTRNAKLNKGPRTLQPNEAIRHYPARCYDLWGLIWDYLAAHPNDARAQQFATPIPHKKWAEMLKDAGKA